MQNERSNLMAKQIMMFFGLEINDFAVAVLWRGD